MNMYEQEREAERETGREGGGKLGLLPRMKSAETQDSVLSAEIHRCILGFPVYQDLLEFPQKELKGSKLLKHKISIQTAILLHFLFKGSNYFSLLHSSQYFIVLSTGPINLLVNEELVSLVLIS